MVCSSTNRNNGRTAWDAKDEIIGSTDTALFQERKNARRQSQKLVQEFFAQCRVLANIAAAQIPGFAGWCHKVPYAELGRATAEIVFRLLSGDRRVEHRILKHKNIPVNLE